MQTLIFSNSVCEELHRLVAQFAPAGVFVITDTNVEREVLPSLALPYPVVAIEPGDEAKNLDSLTRVWSFLIEHGATRQSLIINIGGGVVTDLGGFAAATFKRGVRFINIPTTLLSAVDAAVGGKTGINFGGYKNEIGAFCEAEGVIISSCFFATLPREELLSGFAEMLKHALIHSAADYADLLGFDILASDADTLLRLLATSVRIKEHIVTADPHEHGLRRALNLGHTVGHAFESLALHRGRPVAHGYAVAWGLLVEMIIAQQQGLLPSHYIYPFASALKGYGYGAPHFSCDDYDFLISAMRHDKKNRTSSEINFTLLSAPGSANIDRTAPTDTITAALDIFRDLME